MKLPKYAAMVLGLVSMPSFAQPASTAAQMAAIEQSLSSAVVLAGEPMAHRSIAAEMKRLHVPGLSVAVLHAGAVDWSKGYGVTRTGGVPVTSSTLFQAGSISKPVTALAALRLVQKGQLTLDGDVNAQLKGWTLSSPFSERVTLRELLSHTAGTTVHGFPGYVSGQPVPSVDDVLAGRPPAITKAVVVDTAPGTAWRYSGGGYTVIQKLIGDVTGRPFAEVLQDEVLGPAGMVESSFVQPLDATLLATVALPHDGLGQAVAGGPHTYPELAAAGLWSTPTDLLRYGIAVRDSARGAPGALITQALATEMLTPGKGDYGLGLEVHGPANNRDFSHGGSNEGYENFLVVYSGTGDGVAVMTNGSQGNELALEITRSVASVNGWPGYRSIERVRVPISPAALERLIGTYSIPGLGSFSIARDGSGLRLSLKDGVSEPLYASSSSDYFILSADIVLHMHDDASGVSGRIVTGPFDLSFKKDG